MKKHTKLLKEYEMQEGPRLLQLSTKNTLAIEIKLMVNSKSPLNLKRVNGADELVDAALDVRFAQAREAEEDRARLDSIASAHEHREEEQRVLILVGRARCRDLLHNAFLLLVRKISFEQVAMAQLKVLYKALHVDFVQVNIVLRS